MIKNAFKYKNQKITGSNKRVKKDFFNNFFKNKESVDEYQLSETKDLIKILEKQLDQTIPTVRNIKAFKNHQSEMERESNRQRAQAVKSIKRQMMKINNLKEQLEMREALQQADAYIAREKAELQKEVDKLNMNAKKHSKQKEFLDGIQQLIDKDFKAPAQEKQEMDEKSKQAQEEIKKESKIKIGQINGMMAANYDKSIDEELKQLQEEIKREEQSKKGNDIANQKQMLTNLNGANMSANTLTPRGSQKIGSRQQ